MMAMGQEKQIRILCKESGRLLVKTDEQGMWVWCKYRKQSELIPWEQCLDAYEKLKGERVANQGEDNDTASTTVA